MVIEEHSKKHQGKFEEIWVKWLNNDMNLTPEPIDLTEIQNPFNSYIKNGGMVFYASFKEDCVGIVAIKKINPLEFEFSKLVVLNEARGYGLGQELVQKCIDFVKYKEGKALYLQSFHKLEIALKMYHKLGFVNCQPPIGMIVRERTEIIMKIDI